MNKTLIFLIASALLISAFATEATPEEQWQEFKAKYGKNYLSHEEDFRFLVFKQNLDRIKVYQENDQGAQYGVTPLSDLTREEFRSQYLGLEKKRDTLALSETRENVYQSTLKDLPESFDWRDQGAVTPVKNQGSCGSCWAFSAIQTIEGQYAIKYNESVVLSEQQLVDCDKVDLGCNGGLMEDAYTYLQNNGGVALESDYPYQGEETGKCSFDPSKAKVQVTGYKNISTDETEIAKALVELGPLSIAVHADPWQFYFGGISNPWGCGGELDHGVVLVGYGSGKRYFSNTDYWVIKNSWGASWGEKGYIRVVRGSGVCGVNQDVNSVDIA